MQRLTSRDKPMCMPGKVQGFVKQLVEASPSVLPKAGTPVSSHGPVFTDLGISSRGIKSSMFSCERRTSPPYSSVVARVGPLQQHVHHSWQLWKPTALSCLLCMCAQTPSVAQTSKKPLTHPPGVQHTTHLPHPEPLQGWAPLAKE